MASVEQNRTEPNVQQEPAASRSEIRQHLYDSASPFPPEVAGVVESYLYWQLSGNSVHVASDESVTEITAMCVIPPRHLVTGKRMELRVVTISSKSGRREQACSDDLW
jgi:hypothetical protein